jgi:glycosyltransferase involved in cell wall biosynthesis
VSVITPSLNQGRFIERTIRSVLDQEYPGLQYIVVDGGSSDATVDIVQRYRDQLASWCSEPDRGQVHAINKGLAQATGDVVAFLNSDDVYLPGALSAVGQAFARDRRLSWLCGDTLFFSDVGGPVHLPRTVVPSTLSQLLCWEYKAPQPGMFWRRETLEGGFDERWRYCFDHAKYLDLVLEGHRCHHLPLPVAGYRLHASSKTVAEAQGFEREFDAIAERYEPFVPWLARRRSRAVRLLRGSYAESRAGRSRASGVLLGLAFLTSPFEISRRPFL